ncbi:putative non-specific serine/threonine protein kinase [Helianthus annuus]|nr:putative non-specific serine/threonine protein kinase [Helianthus annuus]
MCKKLVQMMQGSIRVVPNPLGFDQSMSLVLRFQLRPSIMTALSETGESSDHDPQSNSIFTGLQVLFADEDNLNRVVTRKLLEKLGCVVTTVTSGSDCLAALTQPVSAYQVLILDLHMPDLDGFEVASRIRKFRSRNWPLIIGLTSSADEDLWERCIQIGMNGIIQKPVLLKGIADELRRVLSHSQKVS